MSKKTSSLRYRVWNQTRLAMYVDSYLQVYKEFMNPDNGNYYIRGAIGVLSIAGEALYQSMIVHLDMIKANKGVCLYRLIEEAKQEGYINNETENSLKSKIDEHSTVLKHINRQRNNLIAHRSPSLTFKEIKEKFPVSTEDLTALSQTYYAVSKQLNIYIPFNNPWLLRDQKPGLETMMRALLQNRKDVS